MGNNKREKAAERESNVTKIFMPVVGKSLLLC
jgi:hypothetical protein